MKKTAILMMILCGIGINSAIAQPVDDEEKFDDAIQQFGYVSGAALQCATPNQSQTFERDALRAFTGITRLFGSDRAFFYAAAYGAGATSSIDRSKCAQYIRQFQESMQKSAFK